ncbi:(4Fe-4S)-binding protein [Algibacter sp.]|uniref:(4Fe-4S)-binding protein n=1 Tax=Algibacter sp. TaxID=1872428 RepID=UPI003C76FC87
METTANIFRNSDIIVSYKPCICINAERCIRQLSDVFSNNVIPWVNLENTNTKKIIKQIKKCPSGALKFSLAKNTVN